MGGRRKRGQGRKGNQTPENTPTKNKVDDTIPDISENKPTPEKNPSLSTSLVPESLPQEIEDVKLCKTLRDLAVSINNATKTNVFRNEEVVNNFKDAQQIYEGWTTPQKQPTQGSKGMKRKRSDPVANGDDSIKTLEARIVELEEMVRKLEIEKNEFTKKDKLINEELEKWKLKFTNESMAHKNTNDEEKMARDELKKVEVELQPKNYEIQQKNEKLEEMGNEKIKRIKYIEEKEKQLNYLKMQISELQSELDTKNEEMKDLRNSPVANGDDSIKTLEARIVELEEMVRKLEIEKNEFTKKDKLINEELEKWKLKFTNESMAHKNTNDKEKMARDELKKVEVELQQKNYEIQQKNEKLEEMGNEKIKRIKYIEEKEKQLNYLKMQISELQSELDTKNEEMNDLRNSPVANGDDSIKTLEARIVELEEMVRKLEIEKNEFTKKDKLINEELEKWKLKFTNESMAHKNTNDKEKMARDELKKVQVELQQKNYEIQQKNEKLEEMGNEKIKRIKYIEEKEKQLNYLKMQISELQSELDTKNEEMNDLRNRLSSLSASRLDGDPNITDLGDPDRPLKLVDRYQQLYDNLWTDAFDELSEFYKDVEDDSEKEKRVVSDILAIFKDVLMFCQNVVEDQEKSVVSTLTCSKEDVDANMGNIDLSAFRNLRKTNAKRALPYLNQNYAKQNGLDLSNCLKEFTEECLAICWLSLVQDPPMAYEFDYAYGATLDKDIMREFTVAGQLVDFVVWPTLRLNKDGPLMVKSIVQPIKKGH